MNVEQATRLVDAESAAQARIERRAAASVASTVGAVESWYAPADVRALSRQVGEIARSSSLAAAGATDAYLVRMLSSMLDAPAKSVGVLDLSRPLRSGVASYEQIYERVAQTVRYYESTGLSRAEAVARAAERADAMIRTDLALARRAQARRVYSATPAVTGYRRVIRPELSTTGVCGLCVAAADRTYSRADLLPIHDRCRCTTMPIIRGLDLGLAVDEGLLRAVYAESDSTSGRDLKRVRVRIEQHGELGPILVNAAHRTRATA